METQKILIQTSKCTDRSDRLTDTRIQVIRTISRYLGVMTGSRSTFESHTEHSKNKIATTATALEWLLPNVGGPRQSRRRLLASVVVSALLYGAVIWSDELKLEGSRKKVATVYRGFRMTAVCAVCVIAAKLNVDILEVEQESGTQTHRCGCLLYTSRCV